MKEYVHRIFPSGIEEWRKYDNKGHIVHIIRSDGYSERYVYNSKGEMVKAIPETINLNTIKEEVA